MDIQITEEMVLIMRLGLVSKIAFDWIENHIRKWLLSNSDIPADTLCNNNVVVTSKRRHLDVITSKWRSFDVITTLLLCHVFTGMLLSANRWWRHDTKPLSVTLAFVGGDTHLTGEMASQKTSGTNFCAFFNVSTKKNCLTNFLVDGDLRLHGTHVASL